MSDAIHRRSDVPGFTMTATVDPGRGAVTGMAVSADGALVMVTHHGDDSVSLVKTATNAVVLTVTGVDEPQAIAMSGTRAFVSSGSAAHDDIVAFDTYSHRIVATYPVAAGVTDVAVSPNGRYVYATGAYSAEVAILDSICGGRTSSVLIATAAATTVGCIRVSPDGRRLYVATNGAAASQLVVIDTEHNCVSGTVEIGSPIRDVALSGDGVTAYVGSCGTDFGTVLDVVDTRSLAITVTHKFGDAAPHLTQLTMSRHGDRVYLVGDQGVTVLANAGRDVIGTITIGGGHPSCAVESPDGTRLYIADYAGAVTTVEIAESAVPLDALAFDDELTAAQGWAFSDLLLLEPTSA